MTKLMHFMLVLLVCMFVTGACGGSDSTSVEPTVNSPSSQVSDTTQADQSTPSNSSADVADSNTGAVSVKDAPTTDPTPTLVPTPTVVVPTTNVGDLGFQLSLDGEVVVEQSGLIKDQADTKEGIMFFEYGGVSAILLWLEGSESEVDAVLSDSYVALETAQPDLGFSLMNEGDLSVDSVTGKYIAFVTDSGVTESEAGGIVGSWSCGSGVVFSLTVTGSDAAVVQIRFRRIADGFTCGN
ncbi:MAG: hypothetical protein MK035_05445 [Dehalococcoidia bacterium]|nr:hypothetical protein [Dehalococcoidia bacterium]